MVKEIKKEERKGYITGALNLSREKIESAIDGYFHLIKALLYQKGFDPISHEGVYSMLNLHFIKAGTLDKKYSRLFEQLHKAREIADYNPLAPKYDKRDASGYIRTFSELVPGIIEMIRHYDKYSMPVTESVEELRILSQQ